ncbi:hypothetical protein EVAR_654_1 [Eumeta japonica]|uniref:Uncharacterized protein n=1 Tax=Eumeta variegata TaxID=151549 RepID=A0A4C1SEC9_EUMVA|nr:hypothetical protein EVAR_654_1 [Eumeta japonica]
MGRDEDQLYLSRASLGFELLLAMKHHTRELFITGLQFKRGRVNLGDEFDDHRSSTAVNNKDIDAVRCIIETDRYVTWHEICASLSIGMS